MWSSTITLLFVAILCTGFVCSTTPAQQACSPLAPGSPFYHYCSCGHTFAVDQAYQICLSNPSTAHCLIESYFELCSAQLAGTACPPLPIHPTKCPLTQVISYSPNPVQSSCDEITVVLRAYDEFGNPQTYGGAFFTVNGIAAIDNGDGTYTAVFPPDVECSTSGPTPIPVTVVCLGYEVVYVIQPSLTQCHSGHCVPDPHWQGFYTGAFDYHGVGDFWVAESGGTGIQVRTRVCRPGSGVSCPSAFAIHFADGTNYELYSGFSAKLNHVNTSVPNVGQTVALGLHGSIIRTSTYLYTIYTPEFILSISELTPSAYWIGEALSLTNIVILKCKTSVGLLGPIGRHGEVWGAGGALAKPFGDSWMVQCESESFFTYYDYDPNLSFSGVNQPGAPQNYDGCEDTDGVAAEVTAACAILAPNGPLDTQCAQYGIDASDYYNDCVFDGICAGAIDFVDQMISTFATQCQYTGGDSANLHLPPSAPHCTAGGAALASHIPILTALEFTVYTSDALGRALTVGGYANSIRATAAPHVGFSRPRDNGDGSYSFLFALLDEGTYRIVITVNGGQIDSSPVTVVGVRGN